MRLTSLTRYTPKETNKNNKSQKKPPTVPTDYCTTNYLPSNHHVKPRKLPRVSCWQRYWCVVAPTLPDARWPYGGPPRNPGRQKIRSIAKCSISGDSGVICLNWSWWFFFLTLSLSLTHSFFPPQKKKTTSRFEDDQKWRDWRELTSNEELDHFRCWLSPARLNWTLHQASHKNNERGGPSDAAQMLVPCIFKGWFSKRNWLSICVYTPKNMYVYIYI